LVSTGQSITNPDGNQVPAYATPGSIVASIGGTFTCTSSGSVLNVSEVLTGSLQPGDSVSGTDGTNSLNAGATIESQLTGPPGGAGTYQMSGSATTGDLVSCTVTSLSSVLNVTGVTAGVLQVGQTLSDASGILLPKTNITALIGGTGGPGTYQLNQPQTVAAEAMTTALILLAQIQAMSTRDLRQTDSLNLQGTLSAIYLSGWVQAIVRATNKGGDLIIFPDGSVYLVNLVTEPWSLTAHWCKVIATKQSET
jgi:hypothetical protein